MSASTTSKQYELGVLFVHGMGSQQRGDTLLQFGSPLRKSIADRLEFVAKSNEQYEGELPYVRTGHVFLDELPEDVAAPAHAEVTLGNIEQFRNEFDVNSAKPNADWLFAESWWAQSFPTPTYKEICKWGIDILPWVLISHFDRRLRRSIYRVPQSPTQWTMLRRLFGVAFEMMLLLIVCSLSPILVAVVLAMVLVGLIPIPWVRDFVGWIQRAIAGTVGDSYVLVSRELGGRAIQSRVQRDWEWLAARCERIAIVAHSQGGAIAHSIVRANPLIPCDLLITFGSGLRKLSEIEEADATAKGWLRAASYSFLFAGSGLLLAFVFLTTRSYAAISLVAGTGCFAFGMFSLLRWRDVTNKSAERGKQWRTDRNRHVNRFRLPQRRRLDWIDIYASCDPIPNGPLLDDFLPQDMLSIEVKNRSSFYTDHTSYWNNVDDFVAQVGLELLLHAGFRRGKITLDEWRRQRVASARRSWRVGWLMFARCAVLVAAIMLFGAWLIKPPPIIENAILRGQTLVEETPVVGEYLAGDKDGDLVSVFGMLAFVVFAAAWYLALDIVWRVWDSADMKLRFSNTGYRCVGAKCACSLLAAFLSALFVISLSLWTLAGWKGVAFLSVIPVAIAILSVTEVVGYTHARQSLAALSAAGDVATAYRRLRLLWHAQLQKATKRNLPWALYELGLLLEPKHSHKAIKAWRKAVELDSRDAACALGRHFEKKFQQSAQQQDANAAIAAYEQGIDLGDEFCAFFLGTFYEECGRKNDAMHAYQEGMKLKDAQSPECAWRLGVLLRESDIEAAKKALAEAVVFGDVDAIIDLGRIWKEQADELGSNENDSGVVNDALMEAETLFRKGLRYGSDDAARELGNILRDRGDIEDARSVYEIGVRLRNPAAAFELAQLLEDEGEIQGSLKMYRRCCELDLGGYLGLRADAGVGRILENMGRNKAAMRCYQRASGKYGHLNGDAEAANQLGILRLKENDEEGAIRAFRRAIQLECAEAASKLGRLYHSRYEFKRSCRAYMRGIRLWSVGSADALLAYLEEYPNSAMISATARLGFKFFSDQQLYRLGVLLLRIHKTKHARNAFTAAARFAMAKLQLGILDEIEGNADAAGQQFDAVLNSGSAEAVFLLAKHRLRKGNIEEARKSLQKASELGHPEAEKTLQGLDSIKDDDI